MSDTALIEHARRIAAQVIPEDLSEVEADEDLRDYGLDSIRVMDMLAILTAEGGQVTYADLVGGTTLSRIAETLATTTTGENA